MKFTYSVCLWIKLNDAKIFLNLNYSPLLMLFTQGTSPIEKTKRSKKQTNKNKTGKINIFSLQYKYSRDIQEIQEAFLHGDVQRMIHTKRNEWNINQGNLQFFKLL